MASVTEGTVRTEEDTLRSDIVGVMNQYEARRIKKRSYEGIKAKQVKVAKGEDTWRSRGSDKQKRKTDGYKKEQERRRALKALNH